ncbi:hypothetical protein CRV08_13030 [Halarcobacter ebronensis]|uniref:DUF2267 domain-containing protein n=1 Tax=Halarcobacter ebronensis TaxID=1462615 RepID=A0A4Q0Y856_9BACT|nr:DUF2267 domain-containing protein [Halarcobacter ebronensis]RXJ66396.1 hypothetical protein CRV08_13030 [Halarcobacter ebronensis]
MPFPIEYATATQDFYNFMDDVKHKADFHSFHVTYTMVQGVFQTFRSRVTVDEALKFANCLPVALRALFVKDWDVNQVQKEFESFEIMNEDVKSLRSDHNFSRDNAIEIVSSVLLNHVEQVYFSKMMDNMSDEIKLFWNYKSPNI